MRPRKIKIKFNSEEDRTKGFSVMFNTKRGFSGVGHNLFYIPEDILLELDINGVNYTVLE